MVSPRSPQYQIIRGCAPDHLIVRCANNGVALFDKMLKQIQQPERIGWMQAATGFVEEKKCFSFGGGNALNQLQPLQFAGAQGAQILSGRNIIHPAAGA